MKDGGSNICQTPEPECAASAGSFGLLAGSEPLTNERTNRRNRFGTHSPSPKSAFETLFGVDQAPLPVKFKRHLNLFFFSFTFSSNPFSPHRSLVRIQQESWSFDHPSVRRRPARSSVFISCNSTSSRQNQRMIHTLDDRSFFVFSHVIFFK